jgi:ribosome-associated protein
MAKTRPESEAKKAGAAQALARRIAKLALAKKAEDVVILDLRGISSACDFFVLATGRSEPQVKAVAEHIEETLREMGERPWHVEGRTHRKWVLLDYVTVVAHIFHYETREYYRLENLWADAPREEVTEGPKKRAPREEE